VTGNQSLAIDAVIGSNGCSERTFVNTNQPERSRQAADAYTYSPVGLEGHADWLWSQGRRFPVTHGWPTATQPITTKVVLDACQNAAAFTPEEYFAHTSRAS